MLVFRGDVSLFLLQKFQPQVFCKKVRFIGQFKYVHGSDLASNNPIVCHNYASCAIGFTLMVIDWLIVSTKCD